MSDIKGYDVPDELYYHEEHSWARVDGTKVTVGMTDFFQKEAGDIVFIDLPEEEEEVDPEEDLTIEWEPAEDPDPPESRIEFYEVVVEKDEDDERLRVFSVHMLPTDTRVRVPHEFLEAGKDYKVEIIAQETSGNRTAIEVPFETEDDAE